MTSFSPKLIIFDCDGVLVDTEHITGAFFQRYFRSLGFADDDDEALYRYRGCSLASAINDIQDRTGREVPQDFAESFRSETMAVMAGEVRAIDGIHQALAAIAIDKCVASNGPLNKMQLTLSATKLLEHFGDAIFSAYEIRKWKPDPALFLHAASTMKVEPEDCLVIEDSVHGVRAARAAGMCVLAYAPTRVAPELAESGAPRFGDMRDLPARIRALPSRPRSRDLQ